MPRRKAKNSSDTIIEALCEVLSEAPAWRDAGEALLRAMDKFKFPDAWDQIAAGRDKMFPSTTRKMLADKIRKFLTRKFAAVPAQSAA